MVKNGKRLAVGMLSLGCPKTLVDSELILGMLNPARYEIAREITDCDIALLNTCSFIEEAKQESIDYILKLAELKKEGRIKALVVLGCLVQRYAKELEQELGEVDAFMGTGDYQALNTVLDQVVAKKRISHVGSAPGFLYTSDIGRVPLTPLHTRYVKISEGCDHNCSFCTIPSFRGRHRSRNFQDIIQEANRLVVEGARELVLTGQDTTYYGRDTEKKFFLPELLRELNKIKQLRWIRLLYLYPSFVSGPLIEAIAGLEKVCHYVDMPLQHISDLLLSAMKRGMTKAGTYRLIEKLRKRIPDLSIRTTFIVGFPGEGEAEFDELLEFMSWARFERLGIFMYSREEGSAAAGFSGQISQRIKEKRFSTAMALQQKISEENNKRLLGRAFSVLIEGKDEKDPLLYRGRSFMDAPEVDGLCYVRTAGKETALKPGNFVQAVVTETKAYDLMTQYLRTETDPF